MIKLLVIFLLILPLNVNAQQTAPATELKEKDLPVITPLTTDAASAEEEPAIKNTDKKPDVSNAAAVISKIKNIPSLMFDQNENQEVDRAIDSFKTNKTYVPADTEEDFSNLSEEDKKKRAENKKAKDAASNSLKENERSYIYLASIMYSSPDNWTTWVDNQKITSSNNSPDKEFYVKSINQDNIKLLWTLSASKWRIIAGKKSDDEAPKVNEKNQVEIEFELKPNQTFVLKKSLVIEGKVTNFSKK